MKDHAQIGRLAMREEGDDWKAYYAMPDTMTGAIFLGSIKMRFVTGEERRKAFMNLMREAVADLIEGRWASGQYGAARRPRRFGRSADG